MFTTRAVLQSLSALLFLSYGLHVIFSSKGKEEFERYQMPHMRLLTGLLECIGALGLLVGFYSPTLLTVSALCLTLLMFAAIIVRVKIKDSFLSMVPAGILMLLNLYIAF